MNFHTLMREHDQIDSLTQALEGCCAKPVPDVDVVIETRSRLRLVLDAHLAHEDEAIYPRLAEAGGHSADAIQRFDATFAQLRADWSDYLADWDAECLALDWESFQRETTAIMARMRDRTAYETALLYPLALKNGSINLRDA